MTPPLFPRRLARAVVTLPLLVLLAACGGADDLGPHITQVKPGTLKYGQLAFIQIAGQYLRSDMVAHTGSCLSPSFNVLSTTDRAILNCKISAVGPLAVRIESASGALLFEATYTVPAPQVTLTTTHGPMVLELYPQAVAATVDNFLQYVQAGFYKDTLFHRVIPGFVVQAGGYTAGLTKREGQRAPIALQSNQGLRNVRASVAMARTSAPDSATSEFFVNLADNAFLDYRSAESPGYAVFGTVISGMDSADAIAAATTTTADNGFQDVPVTDIVILSAVQTQ